MNDTTAKPSDQYESLLSALRDYFGPMDDPSIGWVGRSRPNSDFFKCERCDQEDKDCTQIPHTRYCTAERLRIELIKALGDTE
jgi:hypothetical protein